MEQIIKLNRNIMLINPNIYNIQPKLSYVNGYLYIENVFFPANFVIEYSRDRFFKNIDSAILQATIQPPLYKSPKEEFSLNKFLSLLHLQPLIIATEKIITETNSGRDGEEIIKFIGICVSSNAIFEQSSSVNIQIMAIDLLTYLLQSTNIYLYNNNMNIGFYNSPILKKPVADIQRIFMNALDDKNTFKIFKELLIYIGAFDYDKELDNFQETQEQVNIQQTREEQLELDFYQFHNLYDAIYRFNCSTKLSENNEKQFKNKFSKYYENNLATYIEDIEQIEEMLKKIKEEQEERKAAMDIADMITEAEVTSLFLTSNSQYTTLSQDGVKYIYNDTDVIDSLSSKKKFYENLKKNNNIQGLELLFANLFPSSNLTPQIIQSIKSKKDWIMQSLINVQGYLPNIIKNMKTEEWEKYSGLLAAIFQKESSNLSKDNLYNNSGAMFYSQVLIYDILVNPSSSEKIEKYLETNNKDLYKLYLQLKRKANEVNSKLGIKNGPIGCAEISGGANRSNAETRLKCLENKIKNENDREILKEYINLEGEFYNKVKENDQIYKDLSVLTASIVIDWKFSDMLSENELLKASKLFSDLIDVNSGQNLRKELFKRYHGDCSNNYCDDAASYFSVLYFDKKAINLFTKYDTQKIIDLINKYGKEILDKILANFKEIEENIKPEFKENEASVLYGYLTSDEINKLTIEKKLAIYPVLLFSKLREFVLKSILIPAKNSIFNIMSRAISSNLSIFNLKDNIYNVGQLLSILLEFLRYRLTIFPPVEKDNNIFMYAIIPNINLPLIPVNDDSFSIYDCVPKSNFLYVDMASFRSTFQNIGGSPTTIAFILPIMGTPTLLVIPLSKIFNSWEEIQKAQLPTKIITRFSDLEYYRIPLISFSPSDDLITGALYNNYINEDPELKDSFGVKQMILYTYMLYVGEFWKTFSNKNISFATVPTIKQPLLSFPIYIKVPGFGTFTGVLGNLVMNYSFHSFTYSYGVFSTFQIETISQLIPFIEPILSKNFVYFDARFKSLDLLNLKLVKDFYLEYTEYPELTISKLTKKYKNAFLIRRKLFEELVKISAESNEIGISFFTSEPFTVEAFEYLQETIKNDKEIIKSEYLKYLNGNTPQNLRKIFTTLDNIYTIENVQRIRP